MWLLNTAQFSIKMDICDYKILTFGRYDSMAQQIMRAVTLFLDLETTSSSGVLGAELLESSSSSISSSDTGSVDSESEMCKIKVTFLWFFLGAVYVMINHMLA